MTDEKKIYLFKGVETGELFLRTSPIQYRDGWQYIGNIETLLKEREKKILDSFIEFACMKKFVDNEEDWNVIEALKKEYLTSNNLEG